MLRSSKPRITSQQAIERLDAWSDYHHAAAMRSPDDDVTRAHQNQRNNFSDIADAIETEMVVNAELLKACKWAVSALAPFSKEPAEKSGINLLRAAIKMAEEMGKPQ